MGGCQNYGPFLGILRTQTGTLILTTTHTNSLRNQGMGYRVFKQSTVVLGLHSVKGGLQGFNEGFKVLRLRPQP